MTAEFSGIGIGREAATGQVFRWVRDPEVDQQRRWSGAPAEGRAVLREAIAATAQSVRGQASTSDSDTAAILEALVMLIEDNELVEMAGVHLSEGWDPASSLFRALDDLGDMMGDDEDFQSRTEDLRGLARGAAARMRGLELQRPLPQTGQWVIVADDLTPVDTAQFTSAVVGVVTELGGPTSHTAIICRAREIPAVVGATGVLGLADDEWVLVDPVGGRVVPGAGLSAATAPITFIPDRSEPLVTVRANIGSVEDASLAAKTQARGVGLFRTEVAYLNRATRPSLEEQAAEFAAVFRSAPAGTIITRTIDAGSDKPVAFLPGVKEDNPALGVRGFRLSHVYPEFQTEQLQALRAAVDATGRDVHVMAPMIATVEEAKEFRDMAREAGFSTVGIMVETPAIVPMIPDLGTVVDFLSIGTNDLSQYLFAADRQHPAMGSLVDPWQPGLLRTIGQLVQQATAVGLPVGVCGEAAADPLLAIVLAGLGVGSVSMAPAAVSAVTDALRSVTMEHAQEAAAAAVSTTSATAARDAVASLLRSDLGGQAD